MVDPIRTWRLERLNAAGYSPNDAALLSERADVELDRAVGMLENGCPPATAVRILL
jgi:hypothetical protein